MLEAEILQNARAGTAVHCLLSLFDLSKQIGDYRFFAKSAGLSLRKIAECSYTCCACRYYTKFGIITVIPKNPLYQKCEKVL